MPRTLTNRQQAVLEGMQRYDTWPSFFTFENASTTIRILDSLARRGLVERRESRNHRPTFTITEAGRSHV